MKMLTGAVRVSLDWQLPNNGTDLLSMKACLILGLYPCSFYNLNQPVYLNLHSAMRLCYLSSILYI